MSDIKLFRVGSRTAKEIYGTASDLERPLQALIERNLEALLGVQFLASEYATGTTHKGRIDTLGLDENGCPVILEYKRSLGENVINQGLYYLNWLMDHKGEFELLVLKTLGKQKAESINWLERRVICIASDFTKYDEQAVQQMNGNIELIRYRTFGADLLLFELVNAVSVGPTSLGRTRGRAGRNSPAATGDKTVAEWLATAPPATLELLKVVEDYILSFGDDVQRKQLKLYIAYKRLRNFATIEIRRERLMVFLPLNPDTVSLVPGFTRDVRKIGHWGTGQLELTINSYESFERAKPLLRLAYDGVRPTEMGKAKRGGRRS